MFRIRRKPEVSFTFTEAELGMAALLVGDKLDASSYKDYPDVQSVIWKCQAFQIEASRVGQAYFRVKRRWWR